MFYHGNSFSHLQSEIIRKEKRSQHSVFWPTSPEPVALFFYMYILSGTHMHAPEYRMGVARPMYDKKPMYSIICTFRFIQYNLFNKCRYIHARRVKKDTMKRKKASQHILRKSSADVLDSLQTSVKSFFSRIQIFLNFIISFSSLFRWLFFFVISFFCNSSSPIHSLLNLTICIFSLGDRWHWKVNHLSAQSQPQKIAVAKRGNTYTKPTEIKGEIQFVPGGYFTFLTLVFFCFLNKKPSAGCHGIRKNVIRDLSKWQKRED